MCLATTALAVELEYTLPEKFSQQVIPRSPNHNCEHLDEPLMALFDQAFSLYPVLLDQLLAHMDHNEPLGEEFQKTFG